MAPGGHGRRAVLAGMAATLVAAPAAAAGKLVEAKKVFPFLEAYWKLPPAERSRFRMAYAFKLDGRPLTGGMWLVDGAQRVALPLRADGRVERLPTLAQLDRAKIQVDVPEKSKVGVSLSLEPAMAPAAEMDARELAAAVAQAQVGAKKAAGLMALAMPKIRGVAFHGVASGEAELADGRRVALPLVKGVVSFDPKAMARARVLRFPRAPARVEIG